MKGSDKQLYWARNILYYARQHCKEEIRFYTEQAKKRKIFNIHVECYNSALKWLDLIADTEEYAGNIIDARDTFTPENIDSLVSQIIKKKMGDK